MTYAVKEIFKTLQGEGAHAGRAAVFCRFAGCNLWTGREQDRAKAICQFCDTDFVGTDGLNGGKFDQAEALADRIAAIWGTSNLYRFVVCTGGEPLLQLDKPLIDALHERGFEIAVETNGTITPPEHIDWLCVSPKSGSNLIVTEGAELKIVYPQKHQDLDKLARLNFRQFWLQPMDGPTRDENTAAAVEYCQEHPQWRLSLQTHKLIGIP
jgi:7-carboxy-7-deazaguanine synthase